MMPNPSLRTMIVLLLTIVIAAALLTIAQHNFEKVGAMLTAGTVFGAIVWITIRCAEYDNRRSND